MMIETQDRSNRRSDSVSMAYRGQKGEHAEMKQSAGSMSCLTYLGKASYVHPLY